MSYTTERFAIRTIKDGAVTIGGKVFRPREWYQERDGCLRTDARPQYSDLPYRGELDGQRWGFARYPSYEYEGAFAEFVALHSTAARFYDRSEERDIDWPGPNCIDGYFRWDWWYTEDAWQRERAIIERIGVIFRDNAVLAEPRVVDKRAGVAGVE